ncbi:unnamed protein product [Arctogadus glacialis]
MQMYSNTLRSDPVIRSEVRQLRGETAQRGDSSEGRQTGRPPAPLRTLPLEMSLQIAPLPAATLRTGGTGGSGFREQRCQRNVPP